MAETYENLADLIEYPEAQRDLLHTGTAGLHTGTAGVSPAACATTAAELLGEFRARIAPLSLCEAQELYTRTFDLNPICALEIGYHLFGENYKRGEFLAHLRETEAPFELGQEHQLPDYLPVLLRLLPKLKDDDLRRSLVSECLIPALDKMLTALKDSDNPYRFLLEALRTTLEAEAPIVSTSASRTSSRGYLPVLANGSTPFEITRMPFDRNENRDLF